MFLLSPPRLPLRGNKGSPPIELVAVGVDYKVPLTALETLSAKYYSVSARLFRVMMLMNSTPSTPGQAKGAADSSQASRGARPRSYTGRVIWLCSETRALASCLTLPPYNHFRYLFHPPIHRTNRPRHARPPYLTSPSPEPS